MPGDLVEARRVGKEKLEVKLLCRLLIELFRLTVLVVLMRSGWGRREASESDRDGVVL